VWSPLTCILTNSGKTWQDRTPFFAWDWDWKGYLQEIRNAKDMAIYRHVRQVRDTICTKCYHRYHWHCPQTIYKEVRNYWLKFGDPCLSFWNWSWQTLLPVNKNNDKLTGPLPLEVQKIIHSFCYRGYSGCCHWIRPEPYYLIHIKPWQSLSPER
jgi:hypothetical protein